ncbi:kinase-like domain-containing protein [Cladorrhinum sp. PSN332]|nr:kinase-like domain-containing protein [Cladorrhinum sp. PSN332]
MRAPSNRVIGSIREIDSCSWLIGGKLVLSCQSSPSPDRPSWDDGKGAFFVLLNTPDLIPESQPLPEDTPDFQPQGLRFAPLSHPIGLVYSAGSSAAVWRAGNAFIKVHFINGNRENTTREHATLEFLHAKKDQQPLGFDIPNVLYQAEWDNRYYIILSCVPGQTLAEAWPTMDETLRQYYIGRVAEICKEMAKWKGDAISGVDGRELADAILARNDTPDSFAPKRLLEHCAKMGMDTSSKFVLYHSDMGPTNILIDPTTGALGIIDWETAGYVPREWVRTKFHVSSGMDFPNVEESWKSDWRRLVPSKLAELGFEELIDIWLKSGPMAGLELASRGL